MPLPYKILTSLIALIGCASLALSGQLNPGVLIPAGMIFIGYYRYLRGLAQAPQRLIGGLSIAVLVMLVPDAIFISGDLIVAVAHLTILFQAIKSFDLKEPWDPMQVFFMSLLQLVITSELSQSILVGVVFGVFLFVLVVALVFTHFIKQGSAGSVRMGRTFWVVSLCVFAMSVVLFVSIPRVHHGLFGKKKQKSVKTVGFSDSVDLGSFGEVLKDNTVVMRVDVSGAKPPFYWRGVTHDFFNGSRWLSTVSFNDLVLPVDGTFHVIRKEPQSPITQKIVSEPIDADVIFGLGRIVRVTTSGRMIYRDESEALHLPEKTGKRISYTVYSIDEPIPVGRYFKSRYLQMHTGLDRLAALALSVAGEGGTARQKAERIEGYLRANYQYSLTTKPPRPGLTPIEDFLFESKRGYCEHYATSMILMLRAVGIPSRIVTGFIGGEMNAYGNYLIVRQSDAHSWVEAQIEGKWQRFDPTPLAAQLPGRGSLFLDSIKMAWYSYVVEFNVTHQLSLLKYITLPLVSMPQIGNLNLGPVRNALVSLVSIAGLGFALIALRGLLRAKRPSPEGRIYVKFRNRVRRHGGRVNEFSTPADVLAEALSLGFDGHSAGEFIRLYEESRFGAAGQQLPELRRFYQSLRHPNSPTSGTNTHKV